MLRETRPAYMTQNCATFIYVKDNVIDQVNTVSSDYVMGLTNFQVHNSSVVVINNTFSRITGVSMVDFSVILSDSIDRAFIIGNKLTQIDLLGYVFSLTSSTMDHFLFDSNSISNTSKIGAYLLESYECNNIIIENMLAQNVQSEADFISMTCTFISIQIKLKHSTFENIVQKSKQGVRQAANFIFVSTQSISSSKIESVNFQENVFRNITLTREGGYTMSTIGTSFILLYLPQSLAKIQNNTLNGITLPDGTIMTVSAPNLTVDRFTHLLFGDAKDALNLIIKNLTLSSNIFANCQSLNLIGAGLVKLTTPFSVLGSSANVNITNSTFVDNTAPTGALIYVSKSTIQFLLKDSFIVNNLPSNNQGQIYFVNVSGSEINATNSTFISNQTSQTASNYILFIESSSQTLMAIDNCSYMVAGTNSSKVRI